MNLGTSKAAVKKKMNLELLHERSLSSLFAQIGKVAGAPV